MQVKGIKRGQNIELLETVDLPDGVVCVEIIPEASVTSWWQSVERIRQEIELEALSHEASQDAKTPNQVSEAPLLQIIKCSLAPEEQNRLTYLRQQNEAGEITDTEHQELLMYVERVEQQDAKRAEALIQLAQLRKVDLKMLIDEFLPTHSHITV